MKKTIYNVIVLAALSLLTSNVAFAVPAKNEGYSVKVKIKNLKDTTIYLAYHFGDKQYMKDTIKLNAKGEGVFKGKNKLDQGIYLVVMPSKTYFEVIMADKQEFSIENDTANFVQNMKVEGSEENDLFYEDMRYIMEKQKEREAINAQIKENDKDDKRKKELKEKLSQLDKEVVANRKKMRETHPNLLYSKVLYMLEEVDIPESPRNEKGQQIDTFFSFHYYKKHYFDHMDLGDPKMLKTPILYGKVDNYLERVCLQDYDSINVECDMILQKAKPTEETFRFWLVTLLNKYANSKVMGQDAVYVYLVENYYAKNMATWLDSADLYRIKKTAKEMKPTLVGKHAPALTLKDSTGEYHSLYDMKNKYVLLFFYSPDCGHCQKETPPLVAAYDSLKKIYDLGVFAVTTEIEREKWTKFIKDYKIGEFVNVGDIELHDNFREVYDIKSTPRIFLLDKERVIKAKRFGAEQLGVILDGLEKMEKAQKEKASKAPQIKEDNIGPAPNK